MLRRFLEKTAYYKIFRDGCDTGRRVLLERTPEEFDEAYRNELLKDYPVAEGYELILDHVDYWT